ncbi:MAG: phage tail protein [Novosphingobium sp.]
MATLVLTAVGTLIGGPLVGALGAMAGSAIDAKIFGPKGGSREGPRLAELKLTTSSYGAPIPRHFGRMRVAGQMIWATDLVETKDKQGGGKSGPSVTNYSYSVSLAVALSSRPLLGIGRIWADGKLLRGEAGDLKVGGTLRFHDGAGDQPLDPLIASAEAAGQCPAYRGTAYAVFEDLQLSEFGNRIPALSFEVIADEAPLTLIDLLDGSIEDLSAEVSLPGIAGLSIEGPLAETLAALEPFYPIDVDTSGEQLVLAPDRRDVPAIALPVAATSSSRDDFGGNAGFTRRRSGEPEVPVAVLRYYDRDRDYQPGTQRATGRPLPGQPATVELPATLSAGDARSLVEQAAKRSNWGRQTVSWRVTQHDPAVGPGATVILPGHPGFWRVRAWEWRDQGIELTLARMAPKAMSITQADPGRANPAPDLALGQTALAAFELPWDGQTGTVPLIMAVPSSAGQAWPGGSLYIDQGDSALVPLGSSGRDRGRIGAALTVLPPASPLLFDRHSSVDVALIGADMTLPGATMRQLAMGANRALLGCELIQFASAVPIGANTWRLSGLWRGRGGTEAAVAGHLVGEPFAVLDGSGTVVDPTMLGASPLAKVVAIGLADPAPVTTPILLKGIGWRPPSPVHPRWATLQGGIRRLSWTRRARGGWLWLDGVETPLAEQAEAYEITYGLAVDVSARWETFEPRLDLDSAALAALLAAVPQGRFAVRQRGDRALSEALNVAPPLS